MSGIKLELFQTENGPCPYKKKENWQNISFYTNNLTPENYTNLLNRGFRRSGHYIYHPVCSTCKSCIPIRVDVQNFRKSKSQRRTWRKNEDIRIEHHPAKFNSEDFDLYKRYQRDWHTLGDQINEFEYYDSLIKTPVDTQIIRYFLETKLVGIGWLDILPNLLSSIYFVFDPEFSTRRLGVFSLLYEIEYAKLLDIRWLYLGYWVENSSKMNYKAEFKPAQILQDFQWENY